MITSKFNIRGNELILEHFIIMMYLIKELLGMRIFNFVNFENLFYMKLYSLLILKKRQKCNKNNGKAPKQVCLHHIAHQTKDTDHLRRHDQSNHMLTSIAAALN